MNKVTFSYIYPMIVAILCSGIFYLQTMNNQSVPSLGRLGLTVLIALISFAITEVYMDKYRKERQPKDKIAKEEEWWDRL